MYHRFEIKNRKLVKAGGEVSMPGVWDTSNVIDQPWLADLAGKKILDAGCRDGWFSLLFSQMGCNVSAMDWDDLSRRREVKELTGLDYTFYHETLYQASLIVDEFDVVWISDVVCHLLNPVLALSQLRQKTRGWIYVGFDHTEVAGELVDHYGGWAKDSPVMALGGRDYPNLHTIESMTRLLEIAGFTDVERVGNYTIKLDTAPSDWGESKTTRVNHVLKARPGGQFIPERDVVGWKYENRE